MSKSAPVMHTAFDLFAGAGGFTLAAINCGVQVKFAVEIDDHARTTYHNNFIKYKRTGSPILSSVKDFLEIDWNLALEKVGLKPGDCSIVMGGPPCQGFSSHRKGKTGDPRNELLVRYFEAVAKIQPRAFVVENVPGLLWPQYDIYRSRFTKAAEEIGYEVLEPEVLNARDFGVPQHRKRVFIIGFRKSRPKGFVWPPERTHYPPDSLEVSLGLFPKWVPASVVFQSPLRSDDSNAIHMKHSKELISVFRSTPRNGSRLDSSRVLPCHKKHPGHKDVYGRIRLEQPGPTMTAGCINPSKGRFVHPTQNHGITARHAARFQTFPEKFEFAGGLMAAGKQIGNAVPIRLAEIVIQSILDGLDADDRTLQVRASQRMENGTKIPCPSK